MPNLEYFRKQAKLYLKWHRERYYPVANTIGSLLPRFRHRTDSQILDDCFHLVDAQELVARKSGYESWEALKKGFRSMNTPSAQATARPFLAVAEPQLFVADIAASVDFYVHKLGFEKSFVYGEPPFYAQVVRDGARLNLRWVDRHPVDQEARNRQDLLSSTIVVEPIKPLFLEYQAAGVAFHQMLRTEPWGARTFIIRDIDGNLIAFAAGGR